RRDYMRVINRISTNRVTSMPARKVIGTRSDRAKFGTCRVGETTRGRHVDIHTAARDPAPPVRAGSPVAGGVRPRSLRAGAERDDRDAVRVERRLPDRLPVPAGHRAWTAGPAVRVVRRDG